MLTIRANFPETSPDHLRLKFTGKKNLLPNGRNGFFKDINDLCRGAGLTGTVPVRVLGQLGMRSNKDRPGAGWHVNAPGSYGVPVSWVESPDRALRFMLRVDSITDIDLCERLKQSLAEMARWPQQKEEAVHTTVPDTGTVLAKILDEPVTPESLAVAGEPAFEQGSPIDESSGTGQTPYAKFVHDADSIELFLMEMVSHANERGEFSAGQGAEMLRSQFGFPQVEHNENRGAWNQVYNALWRLSRHGKLEKLAFGYRIPRDVLERLRTKSDARPSGPVETVQPPVQPVQSETRVPVPASVLSAADLRATVETLLGRSKAYREALERQEHVAVTLAELRAQIVQLQEREAALATDLKQLEATANDASAREAAEELEVIRKLLG